MLEIGIGGSDRRDDGCWKRGGEMVGEGIGR